MTYISYHEKDHMILYINKISYFRNPCSISVTESSKKHIQSDTRRILPSLKSSHGKDLSKCGSDALSRFQSKLHYYALHPRFFRLYKLGLYTLLSFPTPKTSIPNYTKNLPTPDNHQAFILYQKSVIWRYILYCRS